MFFGVSFVIAIVQAFYFTFIGIYLESGVGLGREYVTFWTTLGQGVEMFLLPFLPWFLYRWGMKWVLVAGMLSWGLRYLLFGVMRKRTCCRCFCSLSWALPCTDRALISSLPPVLSMWTTRPPDIRGSGQALFTLLTYGRGCGLATIFAAC